MRRAGSKSPAQSHQDWHCAPQSPADQGTPMMLFKPPVESASLGPMVTNPATLGKVLYVRPGVFRPSQ